MAAKCGTCRTVLWTASLFAGLYTVSCTTVYFVHDSMQYDMAKEYCGQRQGGSLAVFSKNFDWDCIPRDQWFWAGNTKECKWYGSGTSKCRNINMWDKILGLNSRPFICTTDEEMDHIHDYDYSEVSLSVCYVIPPPQETSAVPSTPEPSTPEPDTPEPDTPEPDNPFTGNFTSKNSTVNDGQSIDENVNLGLVAGVVSGAVLVLLLTACGVFIFLQRRKHANRKGDSTLDIENKRTVARSETITSRIGSAVAKCKQKLQRKSPERDYETPVTYRQEREYDQLNSPMLPAEVVYAEPAELSGANIKQDELGYLVSEGGDSIGYAYIEPTDGSTADGASDSPPTQRGRDCGNPVYEEMHLKDVIVGKCGTQDVKDKTKIATVATDDPVIKLRTHEYLNSPSLGRLLTNDQKQNTSTQKTQEIAVANDTYDVNLDTSSAPSTSRTEHSGAVSKDSKLSATNDNSENLAKNVKGNKIRNIILQLQGASDA